jgi:hypothetical protein
VTVCPSPNFPDSANFCEPCSQSHQCTGSSAPYCDNGTCVASCSGGQAPDARYDCGGGCVGSSDCLSGYCTLGGTCVTSCGSGVYPNGQGVCGGSCSANNECPSGSAPYCDLRNGAYTCGPTCVGSDANGSYAPNEFYLCGGSCDANNLCLSGCCSGSGGGACYKGNSDTECAVSPSTGMCGDCSGFPSGACVGTTTKHCQ